jgi:hypothetical protein
MAGRARIKSKVVRSTLENPDVLDMFHGVLGTGRAGDYNLRIVYPKYRQLAEHCSRFIRILAAFAASAVMRRFPVAAASLAAYVDGLRAEEREVFTAPDLAALHPPGPLGGLTGDTFDLAAVTRDEYDAFAAAFTRVGESNLVDVAIVTCNELTAYRKQLEDAGALSAHFLTHTAGITFAPLPGLPAVNFKEIYNEAALADGDREFVLLVLHKLYRITYDLYRAKMAPDVDIDEFIRIVTESIGGLRKRIPRCDEAFDKILDSVHLLKDNFSGYYEEYVESDNPTIIMENFVLDVSAKTANSAVLKGQFSRIIKHYKNLAGEQVKNPQMRTLLSHVSNNLRELTKRDRAQKTAAGDDRALSASDDEDVLSASDDEDVRSAASDDEVATEEAAGAAAALAPAPAPAPARKPAPSHGPVSAATRKRRNQKKKRARAKASRAAAAASDENASASDAEAPDDTGADADALGAAAEETPAEETPAEETPAEETPAEETPAEVAAAEAAAAEAAAAEAAAEGAPAENANEASGPIV